MRKARSIAIAATLAVAWCAAAGPGDDAEKPAAHTTDYPADVSLAYRAEMMADRADRTQQQGAGGPRLFGGIQTWYMVGWRNDPPGDDEAVTLGFVTRRVKLGAENLSGDIHYRVRGVFSRGSEAFFMEDMWVGAEAGDFFIRAGQFKPPFLYEESVEWYNQLAAERSNTTDFLTQDYSQGIEVQYDTRRNFRSKLAFTDGIRTGNLDWNSPGEADYAFTGRLDWMLRGEWDAVEDFTSEYGGAEALRIGMAGHHQVAGRTGGGAQRVDVWAATADIQWERNGLSLYGAGVILQADAKDAGFDLFDAGIVAQAGYRYNRRNEVFGRVDVIFADNRPGSPSEDPLIFTTGYNHYFDGASARFTADIMYLATETGNTLVRGNTAQGFLHDEGSPQIVVRLALQFLF